MRRLLPLALLLGCGDPAAAVDESRSGGDATVFNATGDAFAKPIPGLGEDDSTAFFVGNSLFNRNWVQAGGSTTGIDGLGPTFNSRSCSACHDRDGRGRPPIGDELFKGLLLRLSEAGIYGDQLQPSSIGGVPAEGTPRVTYSERTEHFADGEAYTLRAPTYEIVDLGLGPLPDGHMVSPRVAPVMIGLGLLEAIPEADILAAADEGDADGDGISGRPNYVPDLDTLDTALGRFGWKANQPSVRQQVAAAFLGDLGVTSSMFPVQNCPEGQVACAAARTGGEPEIEDFKLFDVVFYSATLAVPGRRDMDRETVSRGSEVFRTIGCVDCHTPMHVTGESTFSPLLSNQTIFPYTDLLLHDMGDELADGRPDFEADGHEWRTPPLWGIGLIQTVNGHTDLLHDGRARGPLEAVMWHGGEARPARDAVAELPKSDRDALASFLLSL